MEVEQPSREIAFVKPVIACLVVAQGSELGRVECAEMDPLLMIRPPPGTCFFMIFTAL
jgi:hypothetical protein